MRAKTRRTILWVAAGASVLTVLGFQFSPPGGSIEASLYSRAFGVALIWAVAGVALAWRRAHDKLIRLEKAVDGSNDVVIMTDATGVITFVNPAFSQTYGYNPEEVVGKTTPRILKGGQVTPETYKAFWEMLLEKRHVRAEIINKTKDGRLLTIELSASAILDARGNITGFLGIQRDVTERKRADEAMRKSEASLAEAQQIAQVGNWEWDIVHDRAWWSEEMYRIFGVDPEGPMPTIEVSLKLMHPDDRGSVEAALKAAFDEAKPYAIDYRIVRPDGTERAVHAQGEVKFDEAHRPLRMVGTVQDITEGKRAEEALRASEERYRLLFEHNLAGVCRASYEGGLLDCNDAYARILGYESREEILAQPVLGLYFDPAEREAYWARLKERGSLSSYELRLRRKDGSPVWILTNDRIVEDQGQLVKEATLIDISERKRAEKALKKTQEQFLQAQKMEAVGRLAGGIAHDFNNLLTVINGYSDLMLESAPTDGRERSHLEEIRRAGKRAAALTRQLLAFSRKQVVAPKVLDLNAIVEGAQTMLRRLIGEDIVFVAHLARPLGQVKADPGQVEQVIMNLVVNARDAMPKGGKLTIETSNAELGEEYARSHAYVAPGNYVMLAVSDTGCGMDAETQSHIFEPFYTTKEQGKGTGLGLSTVFGIVKQSGGHVNVYSEAGRGTTFKVYLPRVEKPVEADAKSQAEDVSVSGTETVLLVEDEPGVRSLAQEALRLNGYRALVAGGAEEALALAASHRGAIHLLLTDVIMPGLNGKELADRLALSRPGVRVLFISGYTADAIGQHGILDAGVSFLPKPFTPHDLLRKLRQTLDGTKP